MDYNQILTTIGVTQGRLETIIIFTVIAIGIGIVAVLYWKFLLAGFFALVILFVFSRSEDPATLVDNTKTSTIEVKAAEVPVTINKISIEEQEFMEDCVSLSSKQSLCEELWIERRKN